MFADDTMLLLGKDNPDQLEVAEYVAIKMAMQYCYSNNLIINQSKTKQLVFGKHKETTG